MDSRLRGNDERQGGDAAHDGNKGVRVAFDQVVQLGSHHADSVLTGLWCKTGEKGQALGRLGPTLGSVVLASLLICEVASAIVGAETVFFSTIVAAWLVLPVIVGPRNVLDAGCFYMLISLGIVMVVGVAS